MSCYEWEAGTIKIPSAEWASVKSNIREAVNKRQEALFVVAELVYKDMADQLPELKASLKAKKIYHHDFVSKLHEIVNKRIEAHGRRSITSIFDDEDCSTVLDVIVILRDPKTYQPITPKLRKPLKKDFPIHNGAVSHFDQGDCSVTFNNDDRTVRWEVYENNHAVDRARDSILGKAFFDAMKKVTWTRDSGGQILGNDEYSREAGREYEGGGGSQVKATFSAEQQKRDKEMSSRSYNSYGSTYGSFRR